MRAIATTGTERNPSLPDLPTIADTVPGYEITQTWGIVVPAGTPPESCSSLSDEIVKVDGHARRQGARACRRARCRWATRGDAFEAYMAKERQRPRRSDREERNRADASEAASLRSLVERRLDRGERLRRSSGPALRSVAASDSSWRNLRPPGRPWYRPSMCRAIERSGTPRAHCVGDIGNHARAATSSRVGGGGRRRTAANRPARGTSDRDRRRGRASRRRRGRARARSRATRRGRR